MSKKALISADYTALTKKYGKPKGVHYRKEIVAIRQKAKSGLLNPREAHMLHKEKVRDGKRNAARCRALKNLDKLRDKAEAERKAARKAREQAVFENPAVKKVIEERDKLCEYILRQPDIIDDFKAREYAKLNKLWELRRAPELDIVEAYVRRQTAAKTKKSKTSEVDRLKKDYFAPKPKKKEMVRIEEWKDYDIDFSD